MSELSIIQQIAVWFFPVLSAITLHEASHAYVANYLGDTTAKQLNRLSFNPLKHVDLIGTVIVPVLVLAISNFSAIFGWAKPVPITPGNFKNPRRDLGLATAAGPVSNLIMAVLWTIIFKISLLLEPSPSLALLFLVLMARAGITINLLLAFLNLLPIPPLDGGRLLSALLPPKKALVFEKIEPFGLFILLALMFTGALQWLIGVPVNGALRVLSALFHLG